MQSPHDEVIKPIITPGNMTSPGGGCETKSETLGPSFVLDLAAWDLLQYLLKQFGIFIFTRVP